MKKEFKNQLTTAILSSPIVYISHFHHQFVDETLNEILCPMRGHGISNEISLSENVIEFDCGRGNVIDFTNKSLSDDTVCYNDIHKLLMDLVDMCLSSPTILLLKDFSLLEDNRIQNLLSTFAYQYEKGVIDRLSTIIIISPHSVSALPCEIEKYIKVIEIMAPNQDEIMELLNGYRVSHFYEGEEASLRMELCRTLQGLQYYDIKQIINSSLVRTGNLITKTTNRLALEEKKNIVRKSGIIEVVDADETFDQVGGLDVLKDDLKRKAKIFKNLSEAQKSKMNIPKGVLIIGMPGCGKTMIAKSVANEFDVSLLRLDINRLMGKYVGESEANLRLALATAEAAHPCVLWIDEIEKAFAGSNGRQNNDMLVMRLMGHFLTWMQERTTPVFIVATANDVMRAEFMRKGRFDEVYFVNFPNKEERKAILMKAIEPYKQDPQSIFDFSQISDNHYEEIVEEMKGEYGGFSGAEIKSVVNLVVEKKFVEFKELKQENPGLGAVTVHKPNFDECVKTIKESVMSNQKSSDYQMYIKNEDGPKNEWWWTNIERILHMQKNYKFKNATKEG